MENLPLYIILWVIVLLILYIIWKYNWIITLRNRRENAFADIDVQLKLRFDLVPNIVNTVKGYAEHEKTTLSQVIEARSRYQWAKSTDDKIWASNMLTAALWGIFALAEAYPDLKANASFTQLQSELSDIENKLAASRRFFNSATTEFNTYIELFPTNVIAWMFSFKRAELFELENREAEKNPVKVEF